MFARYGLQKTAPLGNLDALVSGLFGDAKRLSNLMQSRRMLFRVPFLQRPDDGHQNICISHRMNIRQTDRLAMSHASSRILQSIFMFALLAIIKSAHIDLDRGVSIAAHPLGVGQLKELAHK